MNKLFALLTTLLLFSCSLLDSDSSSESEDAAVHDASNREGYADFIDSATVLPKFSLPSAGFYSPFVLRAPKAEAGGIVRCTFDGSEPTAKTPLFDSLSVNTSTVVTCYEFLNDSVAIKSTQTYFINESLEMAVVSMRVDPEYMREYLDYPPCPNYEDCMKFWANVEYPVHLEFFSNGSSSKMKNFEFEAGIKISGAFSRNLPKKSVLVTIRKQYQKSQLKYPLFKTRPENSKFKALVFRNNGGRFISDFIEDAAATSLMEGTNVDYQRSRQVVVFYNGVFHGIYDMRERLNEHFVENNHGISDDEVNFIKHVEDGIYPSNGTEDDYLALLKFIGANSFESETSSAYDSLKKWLDVSNYANYMAAEIYFRNFDWPQNNVRAWRTPNLPWRFAFFDLDLGIDWGGNVSEGIDNYFDWINKGARISYDSSKDVDNPLYFHNVYKKLIKNPNFRRLFINHAAVLFDYYLNGRNFTKVVDEIVASLGPSEIQRDLAMYDRDPYRNVCGNGFSISGSCMKQWVNERDASVRREFQEEFHLAGDIQVTIASNGNGRVLLDGLKLPESFYTGKFFGGNAMLLTATPMGGATFVSWEDGSTENPRLVLPSNGSTYQASFK